MNPYNMKLESVYAKGEDGEFHLVARRDECETTATAMKEYIERDAAFDALFGQFCASSDETEAALNAAIEEIRAIPAADVRPVVRGKWIEHNYDPEYLSCDFSCSECNVYLEEYYFGEGQWPGKTDHYFCPNCGADMRDES